MNDVTKWFDEAVDGEGPMSAEQHRILARCAMALGILNEPDLTDLPDDAPRLLAGIGEG